MSASLLTPFDTLRANGLIDGDALDTSTAL